MGFSGPAGRYACMAVRPPATIRASSPAPVISITTPGVSLARAPETGVSIERSRGPGRATAPAVSAATGRRRLPHQVRRGPAPLCAAVSRSTWLRGDPGTGLRTRVATATYGAGVAGAPTVVVLCCARRAWRLRRLRMALSARDVLLGAAMPSHGPDMLNPDGWLPSSTEPTESTYRDHQAGTESEPTAQDRGSAPSADPAQRVGLAVGVRPPMSPAAAMITHPCRGRQAARGASAD